MLSIGLVNAQNRQLSGRVTDSGDGSPLANVSVRVVGASTATQTNAQGNYTLTVSENSQVEFSFIGYQSQTQSVTALPSPLFINAFSAVTQHPVLFTLFTIISSSKGFMV